MRGQSAPLKNAVAWRDERGNIHIASTVNGKRVVSLIGAIPTACDGTLTFITS